MLKGVNRQVVEVNQPDNSCFERVLFFVSPDYYGMGETALQSRMNELLKKTTYKPTKTRKKKKIIKEILKMGIAVVVGAITAAGFILFC